MTAYLASLGNVYIADSDFNRIRKVTASTGIISTIAGTGSYSFSGDGGAATSAAMHTPYGIAVDSSANVYFADYQNQRVRKVTASTGIINTIAGSATNGFEGDGGDATSAKLLQPVKVAVDSSGKQNSIRSFHSIYISLLHRQRVHR